MDFDVYLSSTILEALLEKVTNIQNTSVNHTAVSAFCKLIADEPESASLAIQLIICKIQSPKEWEVMQTLNLLETCMENSSSSLVAEVGKFRFLNEMIKLVSPKYLGNNTPGVIRNKIIDLLKLWSLKYPTETKIAEAYEMLVKQGVVKYDPVNPTSFVGSEATNSRPSLFEEDVEKSQMLQKLLKSNKADDLKAANLLIKTMVKEKEEKEDLKLIENNTKLLAEMLSNINPDSSPEDLQLIRELKETCVNMKPTLTYMISSTNKTAKESAGLFEINDLLNDTLLLYHQIILIERKKTNSVTVQPIRETQSKLNDLNIAQSSPPTLLDFGSLVDDSPSSLSTKTVNSSNCPISKFEPSKPVKTESSVNELKDIFDSTFNVMDNGENDLNKSAEYRCGSVTSSKLFQDLNTLGKSLLESPEVKEANIMKDLGNATLDDFALKTNGENLSETHESVSSDDQLLGEEDEIMVNGHGTARSKLWVSKLNNNEKVTNNDTIIDAEVSNGLVEPLSDVQVPLMDIKTDDKKLTAFEDPTGISVCIQLTKNKPRQDVSVFLVLANSRKSEAITNFLFQPVVSKDCRLKLQPASKTELPPYNPYLPMDTIVQIMLIASYKKDYIPLKFVISYNMQDEMVTEMGEVSKLPLK